MTITGSSIPLIEVTIPETTSTIADSYDAVASLIDTANHPRWFAFVDDNAYLTGGGGYIWAIFGCPLTGQASIYRNDSNYGYSRRWAYSTNMGTIPANTKFKVIYLP